MDAIDEYVNDSFFTLLSRAWIAVKREEQLHKRRRGFFKDIVE